MPLLSKKAIVDDVIRPRDMDVLFKRFQRDNPRVTGEAALEKLVSWSKDGTSRYLADAGLPPNLFMSMSATVFLELAKRLGFEARYCHVPLESIDPATMTPLMWAATPELQRLGTAAPVSYVEVKKRSGWAQYDPVRGMSDTEHAGRPVSTEAHAAVISRMHGMFLSISEDWHGAIPHFDKALRLSPKDGRFYEDKAAALVMTGDENGALKHFEMAAKLKPGFLAMHGLDGLLVGLQDRDRALKIIDRVARAQPGSALVHKTRARILGLAGRLAESEKACDKALSLDPNHHEAWRTFLYKAHAISEQKDSRRKQDLLDTLSKARDLAPEPQKRDISRLYEKARRGEPI
jgi:hypothetical protein